MSKLNYLSRVIKNPRYVLSKNFLLHPFDSLSTITRIMNNNGTLIDSVQKLTNEKIDNIEKYYERIINNVDLHKHLNGQYEKFESYIANSNLKNTEYSKSNPAGRINRQSQGNAGFLLYMVVRSLKPDVVVETGVSSGESSSYILQGLEDNKKGKLYSIDLPPEHDQKERNIVFPPGKTSGWAIPDYLRSRWELTLGSAKELLPPLLQKLKSIDIFWHDSLHTYEHMMFEFQTSWNFLRNEGILLSDDITTLNEKGHSPLVDFADMKQKEIVVYNMVGGFRK